MSTREKISFGLCFTFYMLCSHKMSLLLCFFTSLFPCTIIKQKKQTEWNCAKYTHSISTPFCVKCILDLQFGHTGPDRHFCTLAYTQPQPPFRQRFPLCFPETVCRKSMAVDLRRGPCTESSTGHGRALWAGFGESRKNIYSWHRGLSKNKRTANSWFSYQSGLTRFLLWLTCAQRSHYTHSGLLRAVTTTPAIGRTLHGWSGCSCNCLKGSWSKCCLHVKSYPAQDVTIIFISL